MGQMPLSRACLEVSLSSSSFFRFETYSRLEGVLLTCRAYILPPSRHCCGGIIASRIYSIDSFESSGINCIFFFFCSIYSKIYSSGP
jgi:hypothetical protein